MAPMLRVTNEETLRAVLEDWGRNFDEANAPEECGEVPDAVLPRAVEAAIASLRSGNEDARENACAALKAFDAEIARDRDRLRFQLTAERERLVHAEERHAELDALVQAIGEDGSERAHLMLPTDLWEREKAGQEGLILRALADLHAREVEAADLREAVLDAEARRALDAFQ